MFTHAQYGTSPSSLPRDSLLIQSAENAIRSTGEAQSPESRRRVSFGGLDSGSSYLSIRGSEAASRQRRRNDSDLHSYISSSDHLEPTDEERSDGDGEADVDTQSESEADAEAEAGQLDPNLARFRPERLKRDMPENGNKSLGPPRNSRKRSISSQSSASSFRRVGSGDRSSVILSEQSPLLPTTPETQMFQTIPISTTHPVRHEILLLTRYTYPIALTHYLEMSLLAVTVISVGHLGTVELAASSLASMTANVTAMSVIHGFCSALDSLCPQAYTSDPKKMGTLTLRTAVLLAMLLVPQFIIFWNGEKILLLLKQDPGVAAQAALYMKVLSFGIPGYGGFECVRRWLQAQGLMSAPTLIVCVVAPMNVALNYMLVWGPDALRLGFAGAPLSSAISMNLMFIFSLIYCFFFAPRTAWSGLSWDIFKDLGPNFYLGLAGTGMVASESVLTSFHEVYERISLFILSRILCRWWSWEIVGLASSYIGPRALAAQSVLITTSALFYQLPYAVSAAAAVRVGNLLGAQQPRLAQTSSRVTFILAFALALLNSAVLYFNKDGWGRLFSSEDDIIATVSQILPLVALFQITDGIAGVSGGILRGAGRPTIGAIINLTSYYIIGIPVGMVLTFSHLQMGLRGLWIGLTVALAYTSVLQSVYVWRLDWKKEAERIRLILRQDKIRLEGETDLED